MSYIFSTLAIFAISIANLIPMDDILKSYISMLGTVLFICHFIVCCYYKQPFLRK